MSVPHPFLSSKFVKMDGFLLKHLFELLLHRTSQEIVEEFALCYVSLPFLTEPLKKHSIALPRGRATWAQLRPGLKTPPWLICQEQQLPAFVQLTGFHLPLAWQMGYTQYIPIIIHTICILSSTVMLWHQPNYDMATIKHKKVVYVYYGT